MSDQITTMPTAEFDQMLDEFIKRETKDVGELDASLFYDAVEEIFASESEPTTVELQAQIVGSELHLHLPTSALTDIEVHDNVITVHNLQFVIRLVKADELAA